jgi:hypothetical protein
MRRALLLDLLLGVILISGFSCDDGQTEPVDRAPAHAVITLESEFSGCYVETSTRLVCAVWEAGEVIWRADSDEEDAPFRVATIATDDVARVVRQLLADVKTLPLDDRVRGSFDGRNDRLIVWEEGLSRELVIPHHELSAAGAGTDRLAAVWIECDNHMRSLLAAASANADEQRVGAVDVVARSRRYFLAQ